MSGELSFIPLGGIGDVTKNMYLYEYRDQILIVDCGLGFADETMLGVDLLLPDISYLLTSKKKIVGMVLTHGHEDHMGALPFILPQLMSLRKDPPFPIFGTPFTAALANEKLKEFGVLARVQTVGFEEQEKTVGDFKVSFIRVTHSIPDTSHVFIQTPVGNFYHGSDFKFDEFPQDGKKSELQKIKRAKALGVMCLMSDCLGAERQGRSLSETKLAQPFERAIRNCRGRCIVTTYSSHVARLNQIIQASEKVGRKVCFIGRSLIKTKDVAKKLGYLQLKDGTEIELDQIKQYEDNRLMLIVAGSQGQENSGLTRIASGDQREVNLTENDMVIFSSDPIPGNEVLVYELIDTIAKKGARVLYSELTPDFHVSGHGSQEELSQIIQQVSPRKVLPIGGNFRHMAAYKDLAQGLGYKKKDVLLIENGQEIIFSKIGTKFGRTISIRNVYVDEVSGEEIESFVLRDRRKLSEGGIAIIFVEIDSANGQITGKPEIIIRGFSHDHSKNLKTKLLQNLRTALSHKKGRVINWVYLRRFIGEVSERFIFKEFHRRPLVLPVVIEV